MMRFFDERGELTEYGQQILSDFRYGLRQAMEDDVVVEMSENELLLLGSHLHKLIGDAIANKTARKLDLENQFSHLSDEEFTDYLKQKYGEQVYLFSGLTPEELKRAEQMARMSIKELRAALQQGAEEVEAVRRASGNQIIDLGRRFAGGATPVRWEDEEKSEYGVEELREEFQARLYKKDE